MSCTSGMPLKRTWSHLGNCLRSRRRTTCDAYAHRLLAWFATIRSHPEVTALARLVGEGGARHARGAVGSSTTFVAAALALETGRRLLLVVPHLDDADEAVAELAGVGVEAVRFPALETLPGETQPSLELLTERLGVVRSIDAAIGLGRPPAAIVAPIAALMQGLPPREHFQRVARTIRGGAKVDLAELSAWLEQGGYERRPSVESPGEFAVRGGIVDLFPAGGGAPIRLDLFGDEVERLFEIDLDTMASDRRVDEVEIVAVSTEAVSGEMASVLLPELLAPGAIAVFAEMAEILEQGRGYYERVQGARSVVGPPRVLKSIVERCHATVEIGQYSVAGGADAITLPLRGLPTYAGGVSEAFAEIGQMATDPAGSAAVHVTCESDAEAERTRELIRENAAHASIAVEVRHVHRGFILDVELGEHTSLAVVPQHELLHRWGVRRSRRRLTGGKAREDFLHLEPGDLVVHRDHGIARFVGIGPLPAGAEGPASAKPKRVARGDGPEFLTLEFEGTTRLHVPAERIDLVQRYIGTGSSGGPGGASAKLSTVGGRRWKRQKEQVAEAVRDLAAEMLRVQAARAATSGIRFPEDTPWQRRFEAEFPYDETEDQITAIASTKRDMCRDQPMDRLVCGDVGFGKTEVAMRAAFKAVESGKQVGVLVPTTVLAEQHERTFRERFAAYPFRIESISRLRTSADMRPLLADLAAGKIDVIIGTHRLLSKDVHFKDLGLVVVDEEQRFGVEHKQRLLAFRLTADVLTLSATPIPRTLHMSLLGLRDISSLTTPPADRRAIVTELVPPNPSRLGQAIRRELAREGQVFYVHNRVYDIKSVADDVRKMAPDARIVVGHGQMEPKELERVMLKFMRRQADILVSTTIIESGIDIPNANTIIIRDAHRFGLAELHQLRGRVGRSRHRAYCYLVLPEDRPPSKDALRRLHAIEECSMLGAGFRIAMRDLELRGAGNLLGAEQSGHIAAVGYELYCELLEQAVSDLRHDRPPVVEAMIEFGAQGWLPRGWIPADARRMEAYRRIATVRSLEEIESVRAALVDAYSEPPAAAAMLLDLAQLRVLASSMGIRSIVRKDNDIIFRTERPAELAEAMKGAQGSLRAVTLQGGFAPAAAASRAAPAEVFYRPPPAFLEPATLLAVLRKRLGAGMVVAGGS